MSKQWDEDGDPWTIKSVRRSYETRWFAVDDHDVINPAGNPGHYGVIRVPRLAIGVLPIEPDGQVHLVGQWRFPLGRYSWEIPEGGSDPGEAPEETAHRELAEETGLRAATLIKVLEMDLSNCVSDERAYCFLATGLTPGETRPDETEVLKRCTAHFSDVLARCADGRIRDAITVATILRVHHMAVTGELPSDLAQILLNPGAIE